MEDLACTRMFNISVHLRACSACTSVAILHVCAELGEQESGNLHRWAGLHQCHSHDGGGPSRAAYLGQAGVAAGFPGILQWEQQHVRENRAEKTHTEEHLCAGPRVHTKLVFNVSKITKILVTKADIYCAKQGNQYKRWGIDVYII